LKALLTQTLPYNGLLFVLQYNLVLFSILMNMDTVDFLKKTIIQEVFITKDKEIIANAQGRDSQWLFDFRRVLLHPKLLDSISDIFLKRFQTNLPFQIGGLEVAAIPFVTGLIMSLYQRGTTVNGFFIRKSRKKDGLLRMIEGTVSDEQVILVDDVINSGKSFIRQIEIMEALGKKVYAVFVILRFRDIEYYTYFHERGIKVVSIFTLDDFGADLGVKNQVYKEKSPVPMPFKKEWYFKSEKPDLFYVIPKSKPVLDETGIYFGSDAGTFWALSQNDGSVVWKRKIGLRAKGEHIFSSPAIYDDLVFFGAHDGNFYALNKKTGEVAWVFLEADWLQSSPVISKKQKLLFVGLEFGWWYKKGGVVALDVHTGKKVWEFLIPKYVCASPMYSEKYNVVVCGANDKIIYALSGKDGKLLWKVETGGEIKSKADFDEKLGIVVCTSLDGFVYIIKIDTGEIIAKIETDGWPYSDILIHDGVAYIPTLAKTLYAINLTTAKIQWRFVTKSRIFASPVIAENKIYVGCNDARLYELDITTGKETAFFQATERITNGIAYNEKTKKIFLPTFANEIYCLSRSEDTTHI